MNRQQRLNEDMRFYDYDNIRDFAEFYIDTAGFPQEEIDRFMSQTNEQIYECLLSWYDD